MEFCSISKPGNREINEDSLGPFICNGLAGFIVADGLGGHGKGDIASQIAVKEFQNTLKRSNELSISQRLDTAIHNAQDAILLEQAHQNSPLQMKTTFAAVIMDGQTATCGHIGDSRIYVFRHNKIWKHTLDHSVPQMLVLSKEIKERDIRNHPDRNKLLRALGVEGTVKYDDFEVETQKVQALLLCSDGFWENILENEMCSLLKKSYSVQEWMDQMCEMVERRGVSRDMDNYSAIAVWM